MIRCVTKEVFLTGSDGSAAGTIRFEFGRPGIVRGLMWTATGQPTAMDFTLNDETGNAIVTCTDGGDSSAPARGNLVTDGVTDDGAAATDLARGGLFRSGLGVVIAHGDAAIAGPSRTDDGPVVVTVWVEV